MSMWKQIVIALITVAVLGTIANWLLNLHEVSLVQVEGQIKTRIQRLQDECDRKVAAEKEEFQKSWNIKMKEMESKLPNEGEEGDVGKSLKELNEENVKLMAEVKDLRFRLDDVTEHFNQYKSQMEKIASLVNIPGNDQPASSNQDGQEKENSH